MPRRMQSAALPAADLKIISPPMRGRQFIDAQVCAKAVRMFFKIPWALRSKRGRSVCLSQTLAAGWLRGGLFSVRRSVACNSIRKQSSAKRRTSQWVAKHCPWHVDDIGRVLRDMSLSWPFRVHGPLCAMWFVVTCCAYGSSAGEMCFFWPFRPRVIATRLEQKSEVVACGRADNSMMECWVWVLRGIFAISPRIKKTWSGWNVEANGSRWEKCVKDRWHQSLSPFLFSDWIFNIFNDWGVYINVNATSELFVVHSRQGWLFQSKDWWFWSG